MHYAPPFVCKTARRGDITAFISSAWLNKDEIAIHGPIQICSHADHLSLLSWEQRTKGGKAYLEGRLARH
jgi:hypothetical protein